MTLCLFSQVDFLKADLAAVNRTLTPWVVVGAHRPWYTAPQASPDQQAAFESLLYEGGADLVMGGHDHFYARNHP